jgi:hypothetical protein
MATKSIKTRINDVVKSASSQRVKVQEIVDEVGASLPSEAGNLSLLSYLVTRLGELGSVQAGRLRGYILHRCEGTVVWSDKTSAFQKRAKGSAIQWASQCPDMWYTWEKEPTTTTKKVSIEKRLMKLLEACQGDGVEVTDPQWIDKLRTLLGINLEDTAE